MGKDLIFFNGHNVQVLNEDGGQWDGHEEAWFVPKEVAGAIGASEPRIYAHKVLSRHPEKFEGFQGVTKLTTPGGTQEVTIINENGLYMFLMASDLPAAVEFQRKVTEVLKQIRKTGSYGHRTYDNTLDALMDIYHLDRDKLTSGSLTVLIKAVAATAKQPKIIFDTPIGIKLPNKPKGVSKELTDEIYNYLIDWLEKNESHFEQDGGPLQEGKTKFGMIIENRAFIYPEVFRGALLKGGYVEMTALRSLAQEELIDTEVCSGKRRFKIRKYDHASKKQRRFVSLKLLL